MNQEQIRSLIEPISKYQNVIHLVKIQLFIMKPSKCSMINTSFNSWKNELGKLDLDGVKILYIENESEYDVDISEIDEKSLSFPCHIGAETYLMEIKTFMKFKLCEPSDDSDDASRLYDPFTVFVVKNSFNHGLADIGYTALLNLEQDIVDRFTPWKESNCKIVAPVVSLCQSSGTGKSKIACELLKLHFGFYFVFRGKDQTGYPFTNDLSSQLFNLIENYKDNDDDIINLNYSDCTIGKILNFFASIMTRYFQDLVEICENESLKYAVKKLAERFNDNKNVSDCFMDQNSMDLLYRKASGLDQSTSISVKEISTFVRKLSSDPKAAFLELNSSHKIEICDLIKKNLMEFPFLFVIDEAELLAKLSVGRKNDKNGFEAFRRALSYLLPKSLSMFLTLVTKSNIIDLNPDVVDESKRLQERKILPSPIILSSNLNILSKEFPASSVTPTYEMMINPLYFKYLVTFGHGIWSSFPFDSIISLGVTKLVNGSLRSGDYVQALWMVLTGLAANPLSIEAGNVVAKHMGYLFDFSNDLKKLLVIYPPEPVLSMAAHTCIDEITDDKLFSILEKKFQAIDIDHGKTAKIFGGMIILRAIWKSANAANSNSEYKVLLSSIKEEAPNLNDIWERDANILEVQTERRRIQAEIDSLKKQAGIFHLKTDEINRLRNDSDKRSDLYPAVESVWPRIEELKFLLDDCPIESDLSDFKHFKIHKVEEFLGRLLNIDVSCFEGLGLPKVVLKGLVNGTQMVSLDNFSGTLKFGEQVFVPERSNTADERIADTSRFILTEDLLKLCFLSQLVIKFPPGYYGFDYAVPVLLKDGTLTFIGVQIKRANANTSDDIYKMKAGLHLVKCPLKGCPGRDCSYCIKKDKLRKIYENQISIILSLDESGTFARFSEGINAFEGCSSNAKAYLKSVLENCTEDPEVAKVKMGNSRSRSFTKPLITIRNRIKDDILLSKMLWIDKYVDPANVVLPKDVNFRDDGFLHRQFCISVRGWNNFEGIFANFESCVKIAQKLMNPEGLMRHFPEHRLDPNMIKKLASDLSVTFPLFSDELRLARGENSLFDKVNDEIRKNEWKTIRFHDLEPKPIARSKGEAESNTKKRSVYQEEAASEKEMMITEPEPEESVSFENAQSVVIKVKRSK